MRDRERERIMERMREKVRRMKEKIKDRIQRKIRREEDLRKNMAFVALNPLMVTIFHLLASSRVSIDPRSQVFLIYAVHGVNEAVQLLKSLEKFRGRINGKRMEALGGEIREAAWKLEDVLDSHVSHQFLSQTETESILLSGDERQPLLFSLNLQGMERDIDGFIEMVFTMEKLLNPWLEEAEAEGGDGDDGGNESGIFGLSDQSVEDVIRTLFINWLPEEESDDDDDDDYGGGKEAYTFGLSDKSEVDVTRASFISWFATKAASVFLGMKEEYIQDLENLLPEEEEEDYDYCVVPRNRFCETNDDLKIWWINKAAFFVMERDYTQGLVNPLPRGDAATIVVVSSGTEPGVNMVGSTHLFRKIRDGLLEDFEGIKFGIIVGMVGIGKTALAKKIIEDPLISTKFERCIFVKMGPEYEWKEALQSIVAQLPDGDKMLMEEDVNLDRFVRRTLRDGKCLIVLDDFWNQDPQNILNMFPWDSSQSAVLLTTRIHDPSGRVHISYDESIYEVPFLNKDESWDLLSRKIFGEKRCPYELEKAGKRIAENCEGLPLLILTVAGLLSQAEKTPEHWSKLAANKTNSMFVDAYEQVSEVVYPSYYYLPQHLKACFLYLGAFPQNDEVRVSRLISLWSADGFLGVPYTLLQEHAYLLLRGVVSNNVALGTQWRFDFHRLKAFTLHSVCWYLCKREARNEKFLHVLNVYTDASVQGIKNQRHLSITKNIVLSIKDVRDSIRSISAVRSLLCMSPYHQYQVPMYLGLRLLRVLDALTIRFYEFPIEVVKLVQLRYLSLTCNANLPHSISNLWGIQCLILCQHLSINSFVSQSYLPVEIWDLQELEHLQITGRNLPDPPPGVVLSNLLTLLDVGALTCTERVLASIANLQKLRVKFELMPVAAEPLRFCNDTSRFRSLESLQLVVVNPELKFESVAPAPSFSFSSLRKLTLSGFGYPWKDMNTIAELSNLEDLKLKCYAFRGEKWHVEEGGFERLAYLTIEDTDLVQWTGGDLNFQCLRILTIKNCYKLLQLPKLSSSYPTNLTQIRVVDCNPSAVTYAQRMAPSNCSVYVESSWLGDGKLS